MSPCVSDERLQGRNPPPLPQLQPGSDSGMRMAGSLHCSAPVGNRAHPQPCQSRGRGNPVIFLARFGCAAPQRLDFGGRGAVRGRCWIAAAAAAPGPGGLRGVFTAFWDVRALVFCNRDYMQQNRLSLIFFLTFLIFSPPFLLLRSFPDLPAVYKARG